MNVLAGDMKEACRHLEKYETAIDASTRLARGGYTEDAITATVEALRHLRELRQMQTRKAELDKLVEAAKMFGGRF
ncbi:hypothetical protein G4V62_14030 [Bacillaceae bacterium SIJ1]|uniref:hypothetical protein n=1 Tax=Litoribacterium kuwaitense TaxID=1398745 RepID=UPI0013ED2487|nr:hypothetical protein [Litoribacterium kuwaitense]NGP46012.1 hypothetical protein [Litoribacterium kuwaitense]